MNTLWKFFQYAYLLIGIVFFITAILNWKTDREQSYLMFGFAVFTILVFFLKRHFRKKVQSRNNQ